MIILNKFQFKTVIVNRKYYLMKKLQKFKKNFNNHNHNFKLNKISIQN